MSPDHSTGHAGDAGPGRSDLSGRPGQPGQSGRSGRSDAKPVLGLSIERIDSPLGLILVATDTQAPRRIRALDWHDHEDRLHRLLRIQCGRVVWASGPAATPAAGTVSPAALALRAYFDGDLEALGALPVALGGTPFQRLVWTTLRAIRPGTTLTYTGLARSVGRPQAVRAVGAANGANPVSVILPCHRVVGSDDSLRGYAGGIERKRWLLEHERRHADSIARSGVLAVGVGPMLGLPVTEDGLPGPHPR